MKVEYALHSNVSKFFFMEGMGIVGLVVCLMNWR